MSETPETVWMANPQVPIGVIQFVKWLYDTSVAFGDPAPNIEALREHGQAWGLKKRHLDSWVLEKAARLAGFRIPMVGEGRLVPRDEEKENG